MNPPKIELAPPLYFPLDFFNPDEGLKIPNLYRHPPLRLLSDFEMLSPGLPSLFPNPGWQLNPLWRGNFLAQPAGPPSPTLPGTGVVSPTPGAPPVTPAAAPGLTSDQIWKLVTDAFSLVESMDVKGERMVVNGGKEGCRWPEFSLKSKEAEDQKKCLVMFQKDSHADVTLQVRKVKDKEESRITGFRLSYEKEVVKNEFPSNQVAVQGFRFSPPPGENVPFYKEVSPPDPSGFQIKYIPSPNGLLDIPILGYPIYKLAAEDSSELEFTKDYLDSWGLDKAQYYKDAHTNDHRIPQGVMDFFSLIRHADMDPPLWINLNKKNGNPSLFDWLSFEKISLTAHLRYGTLEIPDFGTFVFSRTKSRKVLKPMYEELMKLKEGEEYDKLFEKYTKLLDQTYRLEVTADQKKIDASLIHSEFSSIKINTDRFDIKITGLTAEKVATELPPLVDLIDQIKKGTLNPQVHLTGVKADKIEFTDKKSGISSVIEGAGIGSIDITGKSKIVLGGISTDKMKVEHAGSGFALNLDRKVKISSLSIQQDGSDYQFGMGKVEGEKIQTGYAGIAFKIENGSLNGLKVRANDKGLQSFKLDEVQSTGSIEYTTPDSVLTIATAGNSRLNNIEITPKVNALGETEIHGALGLSGNIKGLTIDRNGAFFGKYSDVSITDGKINLTAKLKTDPSPLLTGFKYSFSGKVDKLKIDEMKVGPLALTTSHLTNGKFSITHDDWDLNTLPAIDVSGTLDFHFAQMVGKNETFNLPGFAASGTLKNIAIVGDAHWKWTKDEWLLERPGGENPKKLQVKMDVEDGFIGQDPHKIPGNELSKWPSNKVVKTELKINKASVTLEDVERVEFSLTDVGTKRLSGLKKVMVHGIKIDGIDAGGVIWAKFPLFYYLRGVFPKIGTLSKGPDMNPSFIRLGDFEISVEDEKPVTIFKNFNTELYEVGGKTQFAKMTIPFLKISPFGSPLADTGGRLITLDLNVKDALRGYDEFELETVPRPLEDRNSRVVPLKPSPK